MGRRSMDVQNELTRTANATARSAFQIDCVMGSAHYPRQHQYTHHPTSTLKLGERVVRKRIQERFSVSSRNGNSSVSTDIADTFFYLD